MKQKIIDHAKTEYNSSPCEFTEDEINLIIEHNCECDNCCNSIFEIDDFPNIIIEENEILCEDCYDEKYRTTCVVCEESYEKEDESDYFFITQKNTRAAGISVGMYKIIKRPIFYGDCITGFDAFFKDSIEKVSNMDINKVKDILGYTDREISADCICPDCAEKYTRKNNFIMSEPYYSIFNKNQRNNFFSDYLDEKLHKVRQDIIHRNITFRGILQKLNKV